ncbi:MAG: hypothetical protein LBH25_12155 [Fibromonadaceae bacterium]|jgi:uncharacterized protein (TIGR02145 family)|nr:hypothetical protein [Fibromonadaceae bacterium]
MKKIFAIFALLCGVVCAQQDAFTDSRDGKKYKTVKIGNQVWMAENLSYNAKDSKCYNDERYKDSIANCEKHGRLYYWKIARTACPKGWHLPTSKEWETLFSFLGGKKTINEKSFKMYIGMEKIKSKDSFAALLDGRFYIDYHDGDEDVTYVDMGYTGCWFSASSGYLDGELWWLDVEKSVDKMKLSFINEVTEGCSVRCVKD